MEPFKRNQVEEAISRTWGEKTAEPSSALRTQLKRLLDTDRGFTRKALKSGPYAFYSSEAPGKGSEVYFSGYEAFALETGLRLLDHGWPQGFAVRVLRHLRRSFEPEHSRILRQDPAKLFDKKLIEALAKTGEIGVDNTDPVFLTLATGQYAYEDRIDNRTSARICKGTKGVALFVRKTHAHSWSLFELVTRAHRLREELALALPRKRGRT